MFLQFTTFYAHYTEYPNNIETILETLGIDCLSLRRNLANRMFVFDALNGHVLCPELLAMISFRIPRLCTRNLDLFVIPHYWTNSRANSLLPKSSTIGQLNLLFTRFFKIFIVIIYKTNKYIFLEKNRIIFVQYL